MLKNGRKINHMAGLARKINYLYKSWAGIKMNFWPLVQPYLGPHAKFRNPRTTFEITPICAPKYSIEGGVPEMIFIDWNPNILWVMQNFGTLRQPILGPHHHTPSPHTLQKLLRQPRMLIFSIQPYFDPTTSNMRKSIGLPDSLPPGWCNLKATD
jgi:hypothetical protein